MKATPIMVIRIRESATTDDVSLLFSKYHRVGYDMAHTVPGNYRGVDASNNHVSSRAAYIFKARWWLRFKLWLGFEVEL
jgi:hypothetical protein